MEESALPRVYNLVLPTGAVIVLMLHLNVVGVAHLTSTNVKQGDSFSQSIDVGVERAIRVAVFVVIDRLVLPWRTRRVSCHGENKNPFRAPVIALVVSRILHRARCTVLCLIDEKTSKFHLWDEAHPNATCMTSCSSKLISLACSYDERLGPPYVTTCGVYIYEK